MEKTDKSAEDFFKAEVDRQWRERTQAFSSNPDSLSKIPYIIYPAIYKVMESYAAQQLSEYKEVIKELLPLAEDGYKLAVKNGSHQEFLLDDREVINRAKALLQESNQVQPPQAEE